MGWADLCDWHDGSASADNDANQLRFRMDAPKLTIRTWADQHMQDFLKL